MNTSLCILRAFCRQSQITFFSILILFTVAIPRALAQGSGSITGVVTDGTAGAFVNGALVTIDDTALQATTDRTGGYQFAAVPAGAHTLTVSYLGMEPANAGSMPR